MRWMIPNPLTDLDKDTFFKAGQEDKGTWEEIYKDNNEMGCKEKLFQS